MEEKVIINSSCHEIPNVKSVYWIWHDNFISIEKVRREELWRINKLNLQTDIVPKLFNVDVTDWEWDEVASRVGNGGVLTKQLKGFIPKLNEWAESYFNEMFNRPITVFIQDFEDVVYLFGGEKCRATFSFNKRISGRNGYDIIITTLSDESSLIINDTDYFPAPPDTGLVCDPVTINLNGTDILTAAAGSTVSFELEDTDENQVIPDSVIVVGNNVKLVFPVAEAPTTGEFLVRFLDLDGTVLKEEYRNAGQDATAPAPPNYDSTYIEFDEWNQSFTNVQADIDVGAIYKTKDLNKSYMFIRVTDTTGLQPQLFLNKVNAGTLTIDWGDSTTSTTTSTAGNITITKTAPYATVGDYLVTIDFNAVHSSQAYIMGNNTTYSRCLLKMYCGANFRGVTSGGTFQSHTSLEILSLNKDFGGNTNHTTSLVANCFSLVHLSLPNSSSTTLSNIAGNCYKLKSISIPPTFTFYNGAFQNSYSLEYIVITGVDWFFSNAAFTASNIHKLVFPGTIAPNGIANNQCLNCYNLRTVIVRSGIVTIGNSVHQDNFALKDWIVEGSTLTTLGNSVFNGCRSLTVLEFPSSLTTIGTNCFANCTSILEYVFNSTTPPTLANINAFTTINSACKIYVPDANVAAYKAATNWITYAAYIYPLSTRP